MLGHTPITVYSHDYFMNHLTNSPSLHLFRPQTSAKLHRLRALHASPPSGRLSLPPGPGFPRWLRRPPAPLSWDQLPISKGGCLKKGSPSYRRLFDTIMFDLDDFWEPSWLRKPPIGPEFLWMRPGIFLKVYVGVVKFPFILHLLPFKSPLHHHFLYGSSTFWDGTWPQKVAAGSTDSSGWSGPGKCPKSSSSSLIIPKKNRPHHHHNKKPQNQNPISLYITK